MSKNSLFIGLSGAILESIAWQRFDVSGVGLITLPFLFSYNESGSLVNKFA